MRKRKTCEAADEVLVAGDVESIGAPHDSNRWVKDDGNGKG